ncbi:hypothetical protein ACIQU5_14125 [Streptomyces sp. NPDC090306]|uniref:hypothetical protein n=1 Tax=Streptomyces sp. NPDC090306 TaxID=3365961 RepID=UPI0037FCDE85
MAHATEPADTLAAELDAALRFGPFHVALRAAIAARGLPLQRVQHHLSRHGVKVGVTSLSYWQQGARRPQRPESLRAVRALEDILRLPEESLLRLLVDGDTETVGGPDVPAVAPVCDYHPPAEPLAGPGSRPPVDDFPEDLPAGPGTPSDSGLHVLGLHERIRIGARRELAGYEAQLIVRARADGVDRFVAAHRGDAGCAPHRMTAHALENCRTGRVRWHQGTGLFVAELLFDTTLRAGDTFLFRYGVEDGTAGESRQYVRDVDFADGQYSLQVRFDAGNLPARCHRVAQRAASARGDGEELVLSGRHHAVHVVEPRVRTGRLGIGWDWE